MKLLLPILLLSVCDGQDKDLEPGLVAEYFDFGGALSSFPSVPVDRKPTFVRVEKGVTYASVGGDFYGTRLESNFYVRWKGLLRVEKAGLHSFYSESDDGSRVTIDGKAVVDNGGVHPMVEKGGTVDLSAGDHPILVEFFQGGGEAGCKVTWQLAGAGRQPLSKAVFHKKGAEMIDWDQAAWQKRGQGKPMTRKGSGRYAEMDHGPFFCGTIDAAVSGRKGFALKGFAVPLAKEKPAAVCFDSELLKISLGWTGDFIGHPSGRDGIEGQPIAAGSPRFGAKAGSLGWAKDRDWKDPRPRPYGPLPHDWARYRGLYLHGEKVVFSYSVAGGDVLDHPEALPGDSEIFARTLNLGPVSSALSMLVCEKDGATANLAAGNAVLEEGDTVTVVGLAGMGASLGLDPPGRIVLNIAAGPAAKLKLLIWNGPRSDQDRIVAAFKAAAPPADLAPLLRGGPGRSTAVITQGLRALDDAPYVVDTLTVPYENPSKSYMRLTGMDFFSDGKRAAVCTMDGDVWIVSGIDASLAALTWKRFASGLFQSLGLRIVDDVVYTLGRDQITRFHDFNGDGEADFYECFNNDCGVTPNYHEFAHDLQTDSKGNFYYAKGSDLGGTKVPQHGSMVRVSRDGKTSDIVATGFRAPNGMSIGPNDEITSSDNQGNWTPATPVNWIHQGSFCGYLPCHNRPVQPTERENPICWIPHSVDNSGGGQVWVTSDTWGPLKGEILHFSYGKCLLFHILREKVGTEIQGGAVKFPFKFQSGAMRGRFNPADGQLYVVGMRGWQTDAPREGAFQRVRYTGKPLHSPLAVKVTSQGLDLTFPNALEKETAAAVDSYSAQWCNLRWTAAYGSDEFWVSDPKKKGREPLPIQGATLSADGKTVSLRIPGLKPVYCLILRYRMKAADGTAISQEIDYTINRAP